MPLFGGSSSPNPTTEMIPCRARIRLRLVCGVAVIGVLGLLVCCSASANRDVRAIGRLVRHYDAALARRDFHTACADSSARARALAVSAAKGARLISAGVTDCPTALAKLTLALARRLGVTLRATLAVTRIGPIHVHGRRATIALIIAIPKWPVQRRTSQAVRENGAWKIDLTTSPLAQPATTSLPAIGGVPAVGQTLVASTGSLAGLSYSYRWEDCDSAGNNCGTVNNGNGGPLSAPFGAYSLVSGDVGHTIRVVVTATGSAGSTSAISPATGVVAPAPAGGRYVYCAGDPTFNGTYAAMTFNGNGWWADGTSTYWLRQYGTGPVPKPSMVSFDDSPGNVMESVGCHSVAATIAPNDPTTGGGTVQRAQIISDDGDQSSVNVNGPSFGMTAGSAYYYGFAFETNPDYVAENSSPFFNTLMTFHPGGASQYSGGTLEDSAYGPFNDHGTANPSDDTYGNPWTDCTNPVAGVCGHLVFQIAGQRNCSGTPTNEQRWFNDPHPFVPGERYVIQAHITWASNDHGAATVWINGTQVGDLTGISTLACGDTPYPVLENYRPYPTYVNGSETTHTNTVWYGGLIRGNTLTDVAIP
jgi:hypothetical protein